MRSMRSCFLTLAGFAISGGVGAAPPVSAFMNYPDVETLTISPNGKYLALTHRKPEHELLTILRYPQITTVAVLSNPTVTFGELEMRELDGAARALKMRLQLVEARAPGDAPYLAPVPNRGKRNEPAWVSYTIARLALARGVEVGELAAQTAENARRFFGLA